MVDKDNPKLDELLSAYLDGELQGEELAFVERALDSDENARRLLEELKITVAAVTNLPRRSAPVTLAENINAQLERSVLLGDAGGVAPVAKSGNRSSWSTLLSMAAALAIVCSGVVWYSYHPAGGDVEMVANRALEKDEVATADRRNDHPFGRKASPKLPATPVGKRIAEDTWKAAADVAQLVAVNADVSDLRTHQFKNEGINLTIAAQDGADAEALTRRFVSALKSVRVADASPSKDDRSLREMSSEGFFLKGRPGVNFEGPAGEQQVLVRLSPRERDKLFAEMQQWSAVEDRAVLRSGPVRVRGLEPIRLALAGRERGDSVSSEENRLVKREKESFDADRQDAEGAAKSAKPVHPGGGLSVLADLARMLTTPSEKTEAGPVGADESKASPVRDDTAVATAARPKGSGVPAAETLPAPSVIADAAPKSDAPVSLGESTAKSKSLVEKKLEELSPSGTRRASRKSSLKRSRRRAAGGAVVHADRALSPIDRREAPSPDEFVTVVFRFVPPQAEKPRPAKPSKAGKTTEPLKK